MKIEIVNWEKYNPRHDAKTWSWFRMENTFFEDPDFFDLEGDALLVFIYLCCRRSQSAKADVKINVRQAAQKARCSPERALDAIVQLAELGIIAIITAHGGANVDVRESTPTNVDVRERTDPGADVRPRTSTHVNSQIRTLRTRRTYDTNVTKQDTWEKNPESENPDIGDLDPQTNLAAPPSEPPLESKSKLSWTETDHKAAKWLQRQIRLANPKARRVDRANLDEWANEFRLMRERDNLTHDDIAEVMLWVLEPGNFWRAQIQSPAKLRAKWDTLTAQMLAQSSGPRERKTMFSVIPAHKADPQAPVAEESTVLWMPPGEAL